jgi:RNA polymerase sigma-70 factor (ECF subfamily)
MSDRGPDSDESGADVAFAESLDVARLGDGRQVGDLVEDFRPYLLAIAEAELPSELRCKLGASDLVQDTLARGVACFPDFRGRTPEELAGWLRQILVNRLLNVRKAYGTDMRAISREVPCDSGLADDRCLSPSKLLRQDEEAARLTAALAGLPDEYRRVIELRHQENRSFSEIGELLGKTENAVSKLWARAVRELQHALRQVSSVG